ncbi:MAG TPA: hypothetical protein VM364_08850 [Vicinamibacterales bacterium]|nr:hypothetical protein [Vicinamibacterales bacterium]
MSIKPSAFAEIRTLLAALAGDDEVKREAAIARLGIIGPRAVERILAVYGEARPAMRVALLRVLETIGDVRAVPVARGALAEGGDVAIAAAGTLRALLNASPGPAAADALDALVAAALDPSAGRRVRLAAFEALQEMPEEVRAPVEAALRDDLDPSVRARATDREGEAAALDAVWRDALEGRLPDDAATMREAIRVNAPAAPLSVLQTLVDRLRAREPHEPDGSRRDAWTAVRGALHQALALRGSRIALYDLRETLDASPGPLPSSFVTAVHAIGDESCLEPLASAWMRFADAAARHQLAAAFAAIVKREKISRRSAVLKRVAKRAPALLAR